MKKTGFLSVLLLMTVVLNGCMLSVKPADTGFDSSNVPETRVTANETNTETKTDDVTFVITPSHSADYYKFYDDIIINSLTDGGFKVMSPVNIYTCMSLVAGTAGGTTQKELTDALGASDEEDLRAKTKAVIGSFYKDTEFIKILPGNSIWLDNGFDTKQECIDKLKSDYGAYIGKGSFTDGEYLSEMKKWLSEKTGGLLDEDINIEVGENDRAMLLSTLYMSARWENEFYYDTSDKTLFNDTASCTYMKCTEDGCVYTGEDFTAYKKDLLNYQGAMWLFLPNEDKTVYDVINGRPVEYIFSKQKKAKTNLEVHLTVPKFDVKSNKSINEALQACGITDIFKYGSASDFSPLSDEPLFISGVSHGARVKADNEGMEAAAYTGVTYAAECADPAEEPEKYYFNVYRTFLFIITDSNNVPLFAGTVDDVSVK